VHYRKLLRFAVWTCAFVFLLPAVLGALPSLTEDDDTAGIITEGHSTLVGSGLAQEEQPFSLENAMTRIALLAPERWEELNRGGKESALQALLDAELNYQTLPPTPLTDKSVYNVKYKDGLSIKQALNTDKDKMPERIKAVCYAVYCKKLLAIASDVDLQTQAENTAAYVETRCDEYMTRIANYWMNDEGDGE